MDPPIHQSTHRNANLGEEEHQRIRTIRTASNEQDDNITSTILTATMTTAPLRSPSFARQSLTHTPRLVKRDWVFYQSSNRLNIRPREPRRFLLQLLMQDWFHVVLRAHATKLVLWIVMLWTFVLIVFAFLYMYTDGLYRGTKCALDQLYSTRQSATTGSSSPSQSWTYRYSYPFNGYFAFALESATTVGYTLPNGSNAMFDNCPILQTVFYAQMAFTTMFTAFVTTMFYARLSRCETRGAQVIFTDKAIVSQTTPTLVPHFENSSSNNNSNRTANDKKKWTIQIRVADIDAAYPVVEAHVRLYARIVTAQSNGTDRQDKLIPLRINHPDDDMGGVLFLSWPTVVTHEIDVYSALYPLHLKRHRYKMDGQAAKGLYLREVDSRTGSQDGLVCPVCGETYADYAKLRNHVEFNIFTERANGYPVRGTHQEMDPANVVPPKPPTRQEMQQSFPAEIICVVEGIDPLISGTFQAIQSYTIDDVIWGGRFADCLCNHDTGATIQSRQGQSEGRRYGRKGRDTDVGVLLDRFHKVEPEQPTYGTMT